MNADQITHMVLETVALHFEEPQFEGIKFTGAEIADIIRYVDAESSKAAAEMDALEAGEILADAR